MTLVELIIVLILFVVFLGIFLSFLVRQRENSHRVVCANQLKRVGEAIIVHADVGKGALPAARIAPGYATWAVQLTPYLRAEDPLKDWDLARPYASQSAGARAALVSWYFCPARQRPSHISKIAEEVAGALGDYACASGDGDPKFPWTGPAANGPIIEGEVHKEKDGVLVSWKSRTTLDSLKRLKSATILVGEKHVPEGLLGQVQGGDGSLYNGAFPASFARVGGPGYGLAASATAPFNNNFGSAHVGLCQFLYADGHVEAHRNSMSERILGDLIRRE